jgi:serrate RNA effector molecule
VNHLTRPYFARLRQAPELASTPQRIEKDLQQIRQLAVLLEDEYVTLKRMKDGAPEPNMEDSKSHRKEKEQSDVVMADGKDGASNGDAANGPAEPEAESEAFERGSEAVERRVEKLVSEMQVQHDLTGDGVEPQRETKKVRRFLRGAIYLYDVYLVVYSSPSLPWICI